VAVQKKNLFLYYNVTMAEADDANIKCIIANLEESIARAVSKHSDYNITIISSSGWEHFQPRWLDLIYNYMENYCKEQGFTHYFIYNPVQDETLSEPNQIPYAFFKQKMFHSTTHLGQQLSGSWNHAHFRALFLCNKADKANRIKPLIKFEKLDLLNPTDMEWSLRYKPEHLDKVAEIAEYPTLFVKSFMIRNERNPDSIKRLEGGVNWDHYDGIPFNENLYKETSFSFIAESNTYNFTPPWITEKTWRAIANHHPFLMFAQPRILARLRDQGYKTFENYFPKAYDHIESADVRFEVLYRNVFWLRHNWNKLPFDEISKDIQHNYDLFMSSCKKEQEDFRSKINYNEHDEKVSLWLYHSPANKKAEPIGNDHLVYYNWGSLAEDYFWEIK
jgi:hypothetical protein